MNAPRLELVPLGTNGFFPSHGRETMSFLLLGAQSAVLLDAGTGAGRLLEPALAARLAKHEHLDVVLTHYHLDHVVGLSYLTAVWRGRAATIHAPDPPLVDGSAAEAFDRLLAPPLFPVRLGDFPLDVEVRPYAGAELDAGGLRFTTLRQEHPGGSVALRLGSDLAYLTDTTAPADKAGFVEGVDLLLHELWVSDAEAAADPGALYGHSAAGGVAALARAGGVRRLMPVHHHPRRTAAEVDALAGELASAAAGVEVIVPEEGRAYPVGADASP